MIIVTGASGELGSRVVQHLLKIVPADQIGVSVREPAKVADLAARGVRVRQADYADAASLREAWEGARHLLLVSSNAAATGGDTLQQHAIAIEVARSLGVQRLFYTSQVSAAPNSHFPPGRSHAATEAMLADSGLAWTALRHGFYAASALKMNMRGIEAGILAAPEDGKVAWTTHDDLAAVDATFLTGKLVIDGPTPPLTGSEALDLADLADVAAKVLGKPVQRMWISEAEIEAGARRAGVPEGSIAVMLGYYHAARAGEFATIDPTLAQLLDRPPQRLQDIMRG